MLSLWVRKIPNVFALVLTTSSGHTVFPGNEISSFSLISLKKSPIGLCYSMGRNKYLQKKKKNSLTNPPYQGIHVLHIPLS